MWDVLSVIMPPKTMSEAKDRKHSSHAFSNVCRMKLFLISGEPKSVEIFEAISISFILD